MKKGKEKRRKITLNKGKRALKMHLFRPARRKLICQGKKFNLKRGRGGGKWSECTIYITEKKKNIMRERFVHWLERGIYGGQPEKILFLHFNCSEETIRRKCQHILKRLIDLLWSADTPWQHLQQYLCTV